MAGSNRDPSKKRSVEKQHTITGKQHCLQSQECHSKLDHVFIPHLVKKCHKYHLQPIYPTMHV